MTDQITNLSPMAKTFRDLGTNAVADIDAALSTGSRTGGAAVSRALSKWNQVRGIPEEIIDTLDGNGGAIRNPIGAIKAALTNRNLSQAGRQEQVQALADGLSSDVMALAQKLRAGLDATEQILTDASIPAKPAGADSTAIYDSKVDLRMSLDAMGSDGRATERACDLLRAALTSGDGVTAWVICSPWTDQYLLARFGDQHRADALNAAVGQVLDQSLDDPNVGRARAALVAFCDPHAALSIRALLSQLPSILTSIRQQGQLAAGIVGGMA